MVDESIDDQKRLLTKRSMSSYVLSKVKYLRYNAEKIMAARIIFLPCRQNATNKSMYAIQIRMTPLGIFVCITVGISACAIKKIDVVIAIMVMFGFRVGKTMSMALKMSFHIGMQSTIAFLIGASLASLSAV